jgi:protein-disulfide isomerase
VQNNTLLIMFFACFVLVVAAGGGYGGYRLGYQTASLEAQTALAQKDKEVQEAKAAAAKGGGGGGGGEGGSRKEKTPFAPSELTAEQLASVQGLSGLDGEALEKALYIFNNISGACQPCADTGRSLGQCYLDMNKLLDQKVCANIPKLAQRVVRLSQKGSSADDIRAVVDLGVWIPLDPGAAPSKGPETAKVRIIEISDFQCPYCKKSQTTVQALREKYSDKLRWYFIHLPLAMHKAAIPAAKAATAAHLQGKFWEFHDALFAAPKLDDDEYKKIASGLGINLSRWEQDRASLPVDKAVQADMQKMGKMGITSTPMFFVNGYRVKGAQPPDAFARIIDAELADGG